MREALFRGLRVVTVEHAVAAPLCTRHLADLGASVVKIERLDGGDFSRRYDSAVQGESSHFTWLNRGKRSIAVDLKDRRGSHILLELLARSDVFVCNLAPDARERLVGDSDLARTFPRLIRCYIGGFGLDGPNAGRKAYDALLQGESGLIMSTGAEDTPARCGISVADVGAGAYAFGLVAAAIAHRERTGQGIRIDVSLFDVLAEWLSPLLLAERNGSPPPPPAGARHATIVPYGPYPTGDGTLVNVAVQNEGQWRRLCSEVLDQPDLADSPRWATNGARVAGRAELEPLLESLTAGLPEAALVARLEAADIPWGRLSTLADAAAHPELEARHRWQPTALANGLTGDVLVDPFVVDGRSGSTAPLPSLGEHTAEVLVELGYQPDDVAALVGNGIVGSSALAPAAT